MESQDGAAEFRNVMAWFSKIESPHLVTRTCDRFGAVRNQHRNSIHNRIDAATTPANQPDIFMNKFSQAGRTSQQVQHRRIK